MNKPLVFIHGSGDSASIWRLQLEHFGPEHAFAIDLPGHGQRPDTFSAEVTVQEYARVAYDITTQELGLRQPIIAGHSLGGAIALMMGLDYGSQLGGMILVGTGARLKVHPTLLENARSQSQEAQQQIGELAVAQANVATLPQQLRQEQISSGAAMLYRDLSACNVFDVMARLQEIQLSTLILCGEEDRLTPVKYSQYLQQHIAGSVLHVIPGAGHYVMREKAEAVNAAIDAWIQQQEQV